MPLAIPRFKATALDFAELSAQFDATPDRIQIAARRAIAKATKWANDKILGEMPELTGIRARIIKGRVRMQITEASGRVWFGLNSVSAKRLKPMQNESGVTADGFQFPDAFIVESLNGNVFQRTGHFYTMSKGMYEGKRREGIEKITVEIVEKAEIAVRQIASECSRQFFKEFKNQLKWMSK